MIGTIKVAYVMEMISVDSPFDQTVDYMLWDKRNDDVYPEILESVRRHGVQNPILIRYEQLCNGHHRIAACVDLGITEIPFTDDPEIGYANEFEWPEERESAAAECSGLRPGCSEEKEACHE